MTTLTQEALQEMLERNAKELETQSRQIDRLAKSLDTARADALHQFRRAEAAEQACREANEALVTVRQSRARLVTLCRAGGWHRRMYGWNDAADLRAENAALRARLDAAGAR